MEVSPPVKFRRHALQEKGIGGFDTGKFLGNAFSKKSIMEISPPVKFGIMLKKKKSIVEISSRSSDLYKFL